MGIQLWMHSDVRGWLSGLRHSDPKLARLAGQAVLALLEAGEFPGPPLAVPLRPVTRPVGGPGVTAEDAWLQARRALANARTGRQRAELNIGQLERQAVRLASEREEAARAGQQDKASIARTQEQLAREQLSEQRRQLAILAGEQDRLSALIGELEELTTPGQRQQARAAHPQHQDQQLTAMALRPGSPDPARASLLFVIPAPDTAVLLAHLTDPGASPDDYQAALAARLTAAGLPSPVADPPRASPYTRYDATSFLDEFFPGQQTEIGLAAAALHARHRAHTLTQARQRTELTQTQVAQRMNIRQERVSAIERAGPAAIEVRTLAAYIAALGGTLEITAHIDGEPITLSHHP